MRKPAGLTLRAFADSESACVLYREDAINTVAGRGYQVARSENAEAGNILHRFKVGIAPRLRNVAV